MQPGQGHDSTMRGFNGYMSPAQGIYSMQQQPQQHGQVPNMNHRPGGIPMPQNVRSHSNPNLTSNQDNPYMSSTPPQMQRSVTSPYGGQLPSPNQVMGMGAMGGGGYQGLGDMMGGGLPPAHGGMSHSNQQPQGMNMSGGGGGGSTGFQFGLPPHHSGRSEYGMQSENYANSQGQLMQHQRYGMGASLSQGMGGVNREEQEFTIQVEDFPALPRSGVKSIQGDSDTIQSSSQQSPSSGSSLRFDGSPPSLVPLSPSLKATNQQSSSEATAKYLSARSETDLKYGLMGLLDVIKMTNRDQSLLSLGCDLTSFGLNLNSPNTLFSSFSSPFATQPASSEPNYTTPACYRMHPPNLKADQTSKFQVETLFYMFYAMPKDLLQATAAQELYQREWKYHGELRLWFKARNQQEMMQSHPTVQYVYFDVNVWESRLFTTTPTKGHISTGFLSEEEIVVKPSSVIQQSVGNQQVGQSKQHSGGVYSRASDNGINSAGVKNA